MDRERERGREEGRGRNGPREREREGGRETDNAKMLILMHCVWSPLFYTVIHLPAPYPCIRQQHACVEV